LKGIDGHQTRLETIVAFQLNLQGILYRITAYVVPTQDEELILGIPWIRKNNAVYEPSSDTVVLKPSMAVIRRASKKKVLSNGPISGAAYAMISRRNSVSAFKASIRDINRALEQKKTPTIEEIRQELLD
jgi:hypothetical protein